MSDKSQRRRTALSNVGSPTNSVFWQPASVYTRSVTRTPSPDGGARERSRGATTWMLSSIHSASPLHTASSVWRHASAASVPLRHEGSASTHTHVHAHTRSTVSMTARDRLAQQRRQHRHQMTLHASVLYATTPSLVAHASRMLASVCECACVCEDTHSLVRSTASTAELVAQLTRKLNFQAARHRLEMEAAERVWTERLQHMAAARTHTHTHTHTHADVDTHVHQDEPRSQHGACQSSSAQSPSDESGARSPIKRRYPTESAAPRVLTHTHTDSADGGEADELLPSGSMMDAIMSESRVDGPWAVGEAASDDVQSITKASPSLTTDNGAATDTASRRQSVSTMSSVVSVQPRVARDSSKADLLARMKKVQVDESVLVTHVNMQLREREQQRQTRRRSIVAESIAVTPTCEPREAATLHPADSFVGIESPTAVVVPFMDAPSGPTSSPAAASTATQTAADPRIDRKTSLNTAHPFLRIAAERAHEAAAPSLAARTGALEQLKIDDSTALLDDAKTLVQRMRSRSPSFAAGSLDGRTSAQRRRDGGDSGNITPRASAVFAAKRTGSVAKADAALMEEAAQLLNRARSRAGSVAPSRTASPQRSVHAFTPSVDSIQPLQFDEHTAVDDVSDGWSTPDEDLDDGLAMPQLTE